MDETDRAAAPDPEAGSLVRKVAEDGVTDEVGRVELAVHKHATLVVGYNPSGDVTIEVLDSELPRAVAAMSPSANNELIDLLVKARDGRGDD